MEKTPCIATLSIAQLHDHLKRKDFSSKRIVDAYYARIRDFEPEIHAYTQLTSTQAYEAAKRVDDAIANGTFDELGLLAGVPIAFKDNMNMQGTNTTCSSHMLEHYVSPFDATCVANALHAGALPLGKLNMDEFAFGSSTETSAFGATHNPWDTSRVPGGSSGGSAAAISAGLASVTLGSDTGGSIRQPASFCGCIGVKPSYGVVSRYGVVAFGSSLDQVGPFARSVRDAAITLDAIKGYDKHDVTSQHLNVNYASVLQGDARSVVRGMRIGVVPEFMDAQGLHTDVKERVHDAICALERMGAHIVEVSLPDARAAMSAYYVLGPCEAFSNLARFDSVRYGHAHVDATNLEDRYELSRSEGFGAEAKRRIMLGSYLLSAGVYEKYYYPAQQVRTLITRDYVEAFKQVDTIVCPVAPRVAFKFGEISDPTAMYLSDMFTISVNIAGNGAMSFPMPPKSPDSLPIGVQIMCPQFKDENMFKVAYALEQEYGSAPLAPAFRHEESRAHSSNAASAPACNTASAPISASELAPSTNETAGE